MPNSAPAVLVTEKSSRKGRLIPLILMPLFFLVIAMPFQNCSKLSQPLISQIESNENSSFSDASVQVTVSTLQSDVIANTSGTLTWVSYNASYCTSSWGDSIQPSGTYSTPPLVTETTYSVTCFNSNSFDKKEITFHVINPSPDDIVPKPTISFLATPIMVLSGTSSTITWRAANASSCRGNWGPAIAISGTFQTPALFQNSSFSVTCSGPGGETTASLEVSVIGTITPPDSALASIKVRQLNFEKILIFNNYMEPGGHYERFQRLAILEGATVQIPFYSYNYESGLRPFETIEYFLLIDSVVSTSVTVSSGSNKAQFNLNLSTVSEGWHIFDIKGSAQETAIQFPFYVKKSGEFKNGQTMPIVTSSFSILRNQGRQFVAQVPTQFNPTVLPLQAREYLAFNTPLQRRDLHLTYLAPYRYNTDIYRPNVTKSGLMNTLNMQAYFWNHFMHKTPVLPLLDGPRGKATVTMATHIHLGRNNNIYFSDPWRIAKMTPDGNVKTLAGFRHKNIPSYHDDPADIELVGDWSQVPIDKRGFHEIWGMAWDDRTFVLDLVAALINGENPHKNGPRLFVADTQNNRIVSLTFSPISHEVPPVAKEFITNLKDPWDVIYKDGLLYVSERIGHRISVYNADTGAFVKTLLQGADLAYVDSGRLVKVRAGVTLEQLQNEPVVAPEGLFLLDDWLYFGSVGSKQIKKVNINSGALETIANLRIDSNSTFIKLAVSDGSFGPRGTVFYMDWSRANEAYPTAILPDKSSWNFFTGTNQKGIQWPSTFGYRTTVAVGQGKLVFGNSDEGLKLISKSLASDIVVDKNKFDAGFKEYMDSGFDHLYGPDGWGYYGLTLPWGKSENIDYFLQSHGHIPP